MNAPMVQVSPERLDEMLLAEVDNDNLRDVLAEAKGALYEVVRCFDGRMPPAGFPLASVVKPAYRAIALALDPAAFDQEREA